MPDNYAIADQFSLLAKIMDIHGENSFKSKSYSIVAYNIEQLPVQLADVAREKIASLKGIGDSTSKKIAEILDTGKLQSLTDIMAKTPPGILEMLNIKGIGPKKISVIWKEMEIESLGELLYACQENRLLLYKGFGAKTQQNVMDAIEFYLKNQDHFLYAEIVGYTEIVDLQIKKAFPEAQTAITGAMRRQLPVIEQLDWITTVPLDDLNNFMINNGYTNMATNENSIQFKGSENILLNFITVSDTSFHWKLFETSCSSSFLLGWKNEIKADLASGMDEKEIFRSAGIHFIPVCRREDAALLEIARKEHLPDPVQVTDIKGIIHSHSTWSDGSFSLEEMCMACIHKGFEYIVISDHSKTAFYARGLSEERIREQHLQIQELNNRLAPFKIFRSIESDILNDGSLDYPDDVLSTFDLVIASVHSNLKMPQEKAMMRLLKAIENRFTTILGHMTGRLLLSRNGYPVNHEEIIEACVRNHVVIELNAHPRRLDIDWSWIDKALEKGAMISIDPDAHTIEGFDDIRFGVLAAQKSGLTKEKNLSSFSLPMLEEFLKERKKIKNI